MSIRGRSPNTMLRLSLKTLNRVAKINDESPRDDLDGVCLLARCLDVDARDIIRDVAARRCSGSGFDHLQTCLAHYTQAGPVNLREGLGQRDALNLGRLARPNQSVEAEDPAGKHRRADWRVLRRGVGCASRRDTRGKRGYDGGGGAGGGSVAGTGALLRAWVTGLGCGRDGAGRA